MTIIETSSNQVVADLSLKRDKSDNKKDKYVGKTSLSTCTGGGKMEVISWSTTRIEATIQRPEPGQPECTVFVIPLGPPRNKEKASFIPERPVKPHLPN